MSKLECVSCNRRFKIVGGHPEYCPYCGNPENTEFGMSVAESNPNITGFRRLGNDD